MAQPMKVGEIRWSNKFKGQHAQSCYCGSCLNRKLADFRKRIDLMGGAAPPDMEHTVPVKPHWRLAPGHLKNAPKNWHDAVMQEVREQIREDRANRNKPMRHLRVASR